MTKLSQYWLKTTVQSFIFYAYRRIELYELDGFGVCVCVNVRVNGYDECREREKEKNMLFS